MTEDAFLAQLFASLPVPGPQVAIPPGDDCAALRIADGQLLLLAVDQVVGGKHYFAAGPEATAAELVGRKLLARNLSDIAAMAGAPRFCLVAAGVGPNRDQTWLARFFAGIRSTRS